ncbi:methyl-accepting chemotaxis protein, partial [Dickeya sp. DW 0440]
MTTILNSYNNLTVGIKLAIGFGLILLMSTFIMLSGVNGFRNIDTYVNKSIISNDINNNLNEARRARLTFQYTHDYTAINKVGDLMTKVGQSLNQTREFSWSPGSQTLLDQLNEAYNRYLPARELLIKASQQRDAVAQKLSQESSAEVLNTLRTRFNNSAITPELRLQFISVFEQLSEVRDLTHELVLQPSDQRAAKLRKAISTAATTFSQAQTSFNSEQQGWLNQSWQFFSAYSGYLDDYMRAFRDESDAAQAMQNAASILDSASNDLYAHQLALVSDTTTRSEWQLLITGLIIIALGVLMAWRITLQLTRPLHQSLSMAEKIASGDLSASLAVSRKDELG